MRHLVYCGTAPVGPAETRTLLVGKFNAIWCPPMARRLTAAEGDALWLVWKPAADSIPVLLGGGRVITPEAGESLWTNRTAPGVRESAQQLGYGGPTNMAFIRLSEPLFPKASSEVDSLKGVPTGLSELEQAQVSELMGILPI